MKKLLSLAIICWLCGNAQAQSNTPPAPAAAPQSATPAPQAPPTTSGVVGDRNATYSDRIPPDQMLTLDANGDKFQARHIADLSGLPRGAVIVLHDSGQHPTWPFTAAALIDDLPLHGWDTLNIELPTPAADALSSKPSTPEAPASAAAASTATPPPEKNPAPTANANAVNAAAPASGVEPQTQARISAAIKYYADQSQRNIVLIGFGSGAIRAAETLRIIAAANTAPPGPGTNPSTNTTPITALVLIAPQQQLNGIDMDLPKLLPLTGISALDMTLDSEPQARAEAEARRRAILHQRSRIYTRLELPPLDNTSDAQHSAMVKRVRSWLQVNAHPQPKPAETKPQNTAP